MGCGESREAREAKEEKRIAALQEENRKFDEEEAARSRKKAEARQMQAKEYEGHNLQKKKDAVKKAQMDKADARKNATPMRKVIAYNKRDM